ncbi:hypothetical protein BDV97DRAFT_348672 [Delphinella strobiligena]|nr:hypothetical protein BDV97DRAFT_348672 [Delphinella strobiligena]
MAEPAIFRLLSLGYEILDQIFWRVMMEEMSEQTSPPTLGRPALYDVSHTMRRVFRPTLEEAHYSHRLPLFLGFRYRDRLIAQTSSVRQKDAQGAFTGPCRLLDIPEELLFKIYEFALHEDDGVILPNSTSLIQSVPEPPLLRTHSILRQGANHIYYRVNNFHIVLGDYSYAPWKLRSPSETGLSTWLSAIGKVNIADIRNLVFVLESRPFSWVVDVHLDARSGRPSQVGLKQETRWLSCSIPSCRPCCNYKTVEEMDELVRVACVKELRESLAAMSWAGITKEELLRLERTVGPIMISHIKHVVGHN